MFKREMDVVIRTFLDTNSFPMDIIEELFSITYPCTHSDKKKLECVQCQEMICRECFSIDRAYTFRCPKCRSLNFVQKDYSRPLNDSNNQQVESSHLTLSVPHRDVVEELLRSLLIHYVNLPVHMRINSSEELLEQLIPTLMGYDHWTMFYITSRVANALRLSLSEEFFDDNWARFVPRPMVTRHTTQEDILRVVHFDPSHSPQFRAMFRSTTCIPPVPCSALQCHEGAFERCYQCGIPMCPSHLGIGSIEGDVAMSCCSGICSDCSDSAHESFPEHGCHTISVFTNDQTCEVLVHVHAPVHAQKLHSRDVFDRLVEEESPRRSVSFVYAMHLVRRHVTLMHTIDHTLHVHNLLRMALDLAPIFPNEWFHLLGFILYVFGCDIPCSVLCVCTAVDLMGSCPSHASV